MGSADSEKPGAGELLKRLQENHDARLLDRIVDLTLDYVYRQAYLYTQDQHVADEVTQEVFDLLIRHYSSIHDPDRLHAWLRGTVIRRAIGFFRRSKKKPPLDLRYVLLSHWIDKQRDPLERLIDAEDRSRLAADLDAALATLPPRERQCVELRWLQEIKPPEVARIMGITVKSVYTLLSKSLKKLSSLQHLKEWL